MTLPSSSSSSSSSRPSVSNDPMWTTSYDILIVGAGIAGSALAHALNTLPSTPKKPLRVCLLERSLSEPDRIVGELLQPGGMAALKKLGLEECTEGIDAAPVHGYAVILDGKPVHIPYPGGRQGRSFHHGRFIQALRAKAKQAACVEVIEATVSELIECEVTGRVLGVRATRKVEGGGTAVEKEPFFADLTVVADGCFSNFRSNVMGKTGVKSTLKSYFVGLVLEDVRLPIHEHGTVCLVKGHGPVLMYQIGQHDTRILLDLKAPLPADMKEVILDEILPQLPSSVHLALHRALETQRLRRMPNTFLPPAEQGGTHTKEGVILLGDSWNMRHPLTGGGMTVALSDVVVLRDLFAQEWAKKDAYEFGDWRVMSGILHKWHWRRKPLASTINILSVALYDLFGADDENLEVLRKGCFKYFELGGECINGPVSLLSGIAEDPFLLFRHFFAVALYSIWVLFTHPRARPAHATSSSTDKVVLARPSVAEYPVLVIRSVTCFYTACVVFLPLMWTEVRWW